MTASIRKRWPLLLIIAIFVAFKVHHLTYPFYWDECVPYNAAIFEMFHHGISLMPRAIDPQLSRGHPLLFFASSASWMKIFGTSHIAEHSFALFISILLLGVVYEAGLTFFNKRTAIIVTLMTAVQTDFFVQSSFMLPEVMVALFSFATLFFYSLKRYLWSSLFLAAVLFTKESGFVAASVLGFDATICLISKRISLKEQKQKIFCVLFPIVLSGIFFFCQKETFGWYIFPYHSSLFVKTLPLFLFKLKVCTSTLLLNNYRWLYISLLLLMISTTVIARKRNLTFLITISLFIFCILTLISHHGPMLFISSTLLLISALFALHSFRNRMQLSMDPRSNFAFLSSLFIIAYCVFSASNFFTPRYIIPALVFFIFILSAYLNYYLEKNNSSYFYLTIGIVLFSGAYAYISDQNFGDCDPDAYTSMAAQQSVVTYLEQQKAYDRYIATGAILEAKHLVSQASGFLSSSDTFRHVAWDIDARTDYAIFDNIEPEYRYPIVKKDSSYKCVHRFEKDGIWSEVWQHLH